MAGVRLVAGGHPKAAYLYLLPPSSATPRLGMMELEKEEFSIRNGSENKREVDDEHRNFSEGKWTTFFQLGPLSLQS